MHKVLSYISAILICLQASAQGGTDFISAVQAFSDEDYAKAEGLFARLHARDTTDSAVLHYLGLCEFANGKQASAERHLQSAVAADSTNAWYISSLASLYNSQHRRAQTADLLEKLLELKPQSYRNAYTLCLIADVRINQGRDSLATAYYTQALDLEPEYAPARLGLAEANRIKGNTPAYMFNLGKFIENMEVEGQMKSEYLQMVLQNMDARFWWVWGDQLTGLVDKCMELHPDDIQSRMNKVNICAIKQDTLGIIAQCKEIIPIARAKKDTANTVTALSTLGDYYHMQGNSRQAYKVYDEALKLDPRCTAVLNNYAYYLSEERKQLRKALAMSKITIEEEPDNATYLDTYAWILYLLKKPAEAKPYFKHAMIYGGKDSAVILQHYSDVLKALGENDLSSYYHSLAERKK